MSKTMKIVLVDDHEVVRLGLKALLSRHSQFQVVAEAGNATEALDRVERYQPDVVVMDIRLPGVPVLSVRQAARSLGMGGVGFYPRSGFVHLDTGPVRYW